MCIKSFIRSPPIRPFIIARGSTCVQALFGSGEISKIFGELFFAIDPGYRGKSGEISTQYSNLHSDPDEKFFIPENVYIIGTMNDIDRSVDSFDFAMRRRFLIKDIKAEDTQKDMLTGDDIIARMNALNALEMALPSS